MATIINASNSTGLTLTSDLSGVLQLQQNGVALPALSVAPAFSAYLPTARQNVTTSTWTKVALSAEEFDTNNNFDSTTNYRFTPTVTGYYQIQGTITFDASVNAAAAQTSIYKNGTSYKNSSLLTSAGAISSVMLTVSSVIYLNGSTDYVELWGNYDASSNPRFSFGSNLTYFSGSLVRGA
jgi:hypothetical protein